MLFTTTLVGSYPQPDWLIDRAKLRVPRVRMPELWRVSADHLVEAQDDATVLAVRAQEEAGIDVVTDGEIRRESYQTISELGLRVSICSILVLRAGEARTVLPRW